MSGPDREDLRPVAEQMLRFARALGGLSEHQLLALSSGRSVLEDQQQLSDEQLQKLIEFCPEVSLREVARRDFWELLKSQQGQWQQAQDHLRQAVTEDLQNAELCWRYLVGPAIDDFRFLRLRVRRLASDLEAALSASSQPEAKFKELSEQLMTLLVTDPAAPTLAVENPLLNFQQSQKQGSEGDDSKSQPGSLESLSIKVLKKQIKVGESLPLEIYLSHPGAVRNMTRRTKLAIKPKNRAKFEGGMLIGLEPGLVTITAKSGRSRATLEVEVIPAEAEAPPSEPPIAEPTILAPPASLTDSQRRAAKAEHVRTDAETRRLDHPFNRPMPQSEESFRKQTTKFGSTTERFDDLIDSEMGTGTARFLGGDVPSIMPTPKRGERPPLVLALMLLLPETDRSGLQVRIDGHAPLALSPTVYFLHVLLRPGSRPFEIMIMEGSRVIARDELTVTWSVPTTPGSTLNADSGTPPACLELLWRYEQHRPQQATRLRVLLSKDSSAVTRPDLRERLALSRKPGGHFGCGLDLVNGQTPVSIIGRSGEHRMDFALNRSAPLW